MPWLWWLLEWAGFVGGGLWAMLDVLVRGVAAFMIWRWWRESEREDGDGALIEHAVHGEGAAPAEQRESQGATAEDCRV